MKVLKLSVIALTLGFFVTSCGDANTEATAPAETTEAVVPAETPAPEAAMAPATMDSTATPAVDAAVPETK